MQSPQIHYIWANLLYNKEMSSFFRFAFFWAITVLLSLTVLAQTPSGKPITEVPSDPAQVEPLFISFQKVLPLQPNSLNLFGYETAKVAWGWPILSPDRQLMATTKAFFMPDDDQTYSRAFILPVGPLPNLMEMSSTAWQQKLSTMQAKGQSMPETIPIKEVNPLAFWDRYDAKKQSTKGLNIHEVGFDKNQPARFDMLQVVDWSEDGQQILLTYKPGGHHMGVRRCIPMLYRLASQDLISFTTLPKRIWNDTVKQERVLPRTPDLVWDTCPIGWRSGSNDAFLLKQVVFRNNQEVIVGFWQYNISTGLVDDLGEQISPDIVARNGWVVKFQDPRFPKQGIKHYGPGEVPQEVRKANDPKQTPQQPEPRRWQDRVLFWKKRS